MTRPDRPHVIVINCDDLGYGDLGCYGSTLNSTPALDRLATEGVRFTNFYAASPVCSPSRGALLTGCYPPRIGFGSFDGFPVLFPGQGLGLDPNETTLSSVFRASGYRTAMVGKWHCGDQPEFLPTRHGFEQYFGLPYSNDMGRQEGQSFMEYPPLPLLDNESVIEAQPDQASLTSRYLTEAVRFIRRHAHEPFFLYLAHMYVHLPIYVQERFLRQSRNGAYGAAVASIDWATEVLVHELDQAGIAENTIIVFTSDNGSLGQNGGSNAPLRGAKTTTWEGGMKVPLIVRWPHGIPAGHECDALGANIDLLPTLASLCAVPIPAQHEMDGVDLSAQWQDPQSGSAPPRDNAAPDRDTATSDAGDQRDGGMGRSSLAYYFMNDLEAIRMGPWKLHFSKHRTPTRALFHLGSDPGETRDVLDEHPDIVARLEGEAERHRRSIGDRLRHQRGSAIRAVGRVEHPRMLTQFDPDMPYYLAEYDLSDRG